MPSGRLPPLAHSPTATFWREKAALIDWQTPFTSVLDHSRPPFAKWFVGGRTNLCHNAVDRHVAREATRPRSSTRRPRPGENRVTPSANSTAE